MNKKNKVKETYLKYMQIVGPSYSLCTNDMLVANAVGIDSLHVDGNVRENFHFKNQHFKQTQPYTCAIACLMMARSIYEKNYNPSEKKEHEMFREMGGDTSTPSLLNYILKKGYHVRIFSELDYNEISFEKEQAEILRYKYLDFLERNKRENLENFDKITFSAELLKTRLSFGECILINGLHAGVPHLRVISGYEKRNFVISDPLKTGKEILSFEDLTKICNPPLGKWFFTLTKKPELLYEYGI